MKQIIIESTDLNDTPSSIEEKLEKAFRAMKASQESNRQFPDIFMRHLKKKSDLTLNSIINSMIDEIGTVISSSD